MKAVITKWWNSQKYEWYREEYRKWSNLILNVMMGSVLVFGLLAAGAAAMIANTEFSDIIQILIPGSMIILFVILLTSAGAAFTLSNVDRYEKKLSREKK